MTGMIILSFVLGYPVFMIFGYGLYKLLFTPLEKIEMQQKQEKAMLLTRARRPEKRKKVLIHGKAHPTPVFDLRDLNPAHAKHAI